MKRQADSEGAPRDIRIRSFAFAVRVVRLCQHLDSMPGVGRALSNQLLRSGTSIGANVEEAQAGQSKADFISTYAIALKEARETHYWLRLVVASELLPESRVGNRLAESDEIMRVIGAIIVSAKQGQQ